MEQKSDNSTFLVLVTGATGYLASHITHQLLARGYRVRGTTRDLANSIKVTPLKELQPQENLELVEAELLEPDSWVRAVEGCQFVIHTACPNSTWPTENEDEFIKPAVDGTLNVLKACAESNTVKRVVMTSSVAAVSREFELGGSFDESNWTEFKQDMHPYIKGKLLGEKAAWEFVSNLEREKFELALLHPVFIVGPVIVKRFSFSMEIPKRLLEREVPFIPNLNYAVIDVRDVAAAHIQAMVVPEAAGKRHICSNTNITVKEMAEKLSTEFSPQGYNVPTTTVPNCLTRFASVCSESIRLILPHLGKVSIFDNTRMTNILGIKPHPMKDTIIDMGYSMIEMGQVKKTSKYSGPKSLPESNTCNTEQ